MRYTLIIILMKNELYEHSNTIQIGEIDLLPTQERKPIDLYFEMTQHMFSFCINKIAQLSVERKASKAN